MTPTDPPSIDRLHDLLALRTTEGLTPAAEAELQVLLEKWPHLSADAFDAAAAALMTAVAALGDGPLTVKIDIEGGEYALLPPLVAALPDRATTLLCAFHPRILAAAGVDTDTIAALTAGCLQALQGWFVQVLGEEGPCEALSTVLTARNTTIACSRADRRR